MKIIIFVFATLAINLSVLAQGNSGKDKDKNKDKDKPANTQAKNNGNSNGNNQSKEDKAKNEKHDLKVWEGVAGAGSSCMKASKNQPAKVSAAFQRDYPFAAFVRWTKCRGDWTASFNNGIFRSTAVYHANGDRRDTRTFVQRDNIPVRVIDEILKRMPGINVDAAIRIEAPTVVKNIFRFKSVVDGQPRYVHLDADGNLVNYSY